MNLDDLLRDGIAMLEILDEGGSSWQSVEAFADQARATVPAEHADVFEVEAAAQGHGQYEPGEQAQLAGLLDALAAVDHALRGWDLPQFVPGPARAWLPTPAISTRP